MKIPPEIMGGVAAGVAVLLVLMVIYRYLLRICSESAGRTRS
jgi:hypothetical protein